MTTHLLYLLLSTTEAVSITATGDPLKDMPMLQAAINQCATTGQPLMLDATGKAFRLTSTITIKPVNGQHVSGLTIEAMNRPDGSPTFWYDGQGPCIKFIGVKYGRFENLRVQLRGTNGVGFWFATSQSYQSTGGNIMRRCCVDAVMPNQKAGIWIGPEDDNRVLGDASNDMSNLTVERCAISGNNYMPTGFHTWGRNTKDIMFNGCMVSNTTGVAFLFDQNPTYHPRCFTQGTQLIGCDVSHVQTFLKSAGDGNELTVTGGRAESLALPYSFWTTNDGGPGWIKVLGFKENNQWLPRFRVDGQQPVIIL